LHQVGDLFELNTKLRCQKVKRRREGKEYIGLAYVIALLWSWDEEDNKKSS
jgi:hypothetical protein